MSRLQIVKVEEATADQWDRMAETCDYATYYHTREWADLWQLYTNFKLKPSARYLTFSDGVEVLFPMSEFRLLRGLVKEYAATPMGMNGGWLSQSPLTKSHQKLMWNYFSKMNISVTANPYDPALTCPNFQTYFRDKIYVLDLRPGLEALNKSWTSRKPKLLQRVRKATKLGVVVSRATGLEEWKEFYRAVEETMKRREPVEGVNIDWGLLEAHYRINSPKIQLWVARFEGKIISGSLVYFHHRHVGGTFRGNLREYSKVGAGHLLEYELIKKAAQEGFWWYDMGPSLGSQGVAQYKESWLCEEREMMAFSNKTPGKKAYEMLKAAKSRGKRAVTRLRKVPPVPQVEALNPK